ncbi:nitroreductase family protein [Paucisalibacillus sp. EB02]|uniref:nitroreductase family protein n=1 Tax=Paucisalibacillus sp. EB02 TaxID=1347087 RepID=UPI0004B0CE96|nr:nitroreductase family protein [Paucisalibacillus sp. EB02]
MIIDVRKVIRERRTILDYKPEKVGQELLLEIMNGAAYAPNHYMKQPWKIRIYEDDARSSFGEKIVDSYIRLGYLKTLSADKLQQARLAYDRFFKSVPHHILFYIEKEDNGYLDDENFAAVCAYIQNLQLLAWEKGIGSMWTAKETLRDKIFIRDIGLSPEKHKLVAVVQIGYPNKVPKGKERTPIEHKIEWVKSDLKVEERV